MSTDTVTIKHLAIGRGWIKSLIILTGILVGSGVYSANPDDTIAILDFEPNNASASDAAFVTDFIRTSVINEGKWTVVEKKNMEKLLAEQAFQQTGCTDQECAVKIGKILNVKKMITGSYGIFENTRMMSARLVDVETGKIEGSAIEKGFSGDTLDKAARQLVRALLGASRGDGKELQPGYKQERISPPLGPIPTMILLMGGGGFCAMAEPVGYFGGAVEVDYRNWGFMALGGIIPGYDELIDVRIFGVKYFLSRPERHSLYLGAGGGTFAAGEVQTPDFWDPMMGRFNRNTAYTDLPGTYFVLGYKSTLFNFMLFDISAGGAYLFDKEITVTGGGVETTKKLGGVYPYVCGLAGFYKKF